tara:strand:+ start:1258 stop:2190 length:933 start_codon:yes stop_codon:yes gene_type:complete
MDTRKLRILKDILGNYYSSGDEYLFYCPKCNHHKKKLSVNLKIDKFKCWICEYSSNTIHRLVKRYGVHDHRKEWENLTGKIDLTEFDFLLEEEEAEQFQRLKLPEEFASLANKNRSLVSLPARKYLKDRGIADEDILRWKIGYCCSGEYDNRVIIPSFDDEGYINYFVARTYNGSWKKYKNPTTSKDIIFNDLYIDWQKDLSLVEGVFDAIVAGTNSIPILGSTLKENSKLFKTIAKNKTPVYIALDPDAEKKAIKLIKNLLTYGVELYKVDISPYSDVGEMTKEEYIRRKKKAYLMTEENLLLYQAINL